MSNDQKQHQMCETRCSATASRALSPFGGVSGRPRPAGPPGGFRRNGRNTRCFRAWPERVTWLSSRRSRRPLAFAAMRRDGSMTISNRGLTLGQFSCRSQIGALQDNICSCGHMLRTASYCFVIRHHMKEIPRSSNDFVCCAISLLQVSVDVSPLVRDRKGSCRK